ncbi:hypothetical protein FNV1998 [Fusobacterium vincentii ATCC 49256]|uniref:Addiction module antitoxin, RelB/DinJ family n=2 Tax=Fusobacteriaceae TaxID=203492 RepID=Q7P823_FUSVC|nr:hypothetical protein FNV1998 [Fusobacterium vincentii ATCC 49256]
MLIAYYCYIIVYIKEGGDTMAQVSVTVKTDEEIKKDFNTFCEEIGLNMSTAINLFMRAVLREKRIPFELSLSNNETIQVFKDVKEGKNLSKSFSSVKELMEDLNA